MLQFKYQPSHFKVKHKYSSYDDTHAENKGLLQLEAHTLCSIKTHTYKNSNRLCISNKYQHTYSCISHYFISTIHYSNMFQPLKGHLQGVYLIHSSSKVHSTHYMIYMIWYIYLLTAIGLSPGGSTLLHTNNT